MIILALRVLIMLTKVIVEFLNCLIFVNKRNKMPNFVSLDLVLQNLHGLKNLKKVVILQIFIFSEEEGRKEDISLNSELS